MSETNDSNEYRVYGPPGTGKTRWIADKVREEVAARGNGQQVLLTSLTKAAAQVITGRDLPIPAENVSTLHGHCYRALGGSPIAETKSVEFSAEYPRFRLSAHQKKSSIEDADEDDAPRGTPGDRLFSAYSFARSTMMERSKWSPQVRAFADCWEQWKNTHGFRDFTDLIEMCFKGVAVAPGDPAIIFVDEAQDHDRLELALLRKWGRYAERFFMVGDQDQSIYAWRGADPEEFSRTVIPEAHKIKLQQSYRVPRRVHDAADKWVRRIRQRDAIEYRPKTNELTGKEEIGTLRRLASSYNKTAGLMRDIEKQLATAADTPSGIREVMILGSSGFMLDPIIHALKKAGLPFSNSYRKKNKLWNPLRESRGNSPTDRLLSFLRPLRSAWKDEARIWNHADLLKWLEPLKADEILLRGAKTAIKSYSNLEPIPARQLAEYFRPEALERMIQCDLGWYVSNVLPSRRDTFKFPARVINRYGTDALPYAANVTVGTIHSVKGGEADVIYLLPDLAPSAYAEFSLPGRKRDAIIRLFYVAMTRAKSELVLCEPSSAQRISGLGQI